MEGKNHMKHPHAQTHSARLKKDPGTIKSTQSHKTKSSHYIINDFFPECLLLEILYRVPVKSTFRFKCISKHWFSLISDPSFKRNHHSRLRDLPLWTLQYRFVEGIIPNVPTENNKFNFVTSKHLVFNSPDFPFAFISSTEQQQHQQELKNFQVVASSDDLLLTNRHGVYCVCNPFTKQCIELPPCPNKSSQGLGFISKNKNGFAHYKVVVITNCSNSQNQEPDFIFGCDTIQVQIFSSQNGKWTKSEISLPRPINLETPLMGAVPYKGNMHWIDSPIGIVIACNPFNESNECSLLELPNDRENWRMGGLNGVLAVCQGQLRYFEIASIFQRPGELESWSVWVLKDYNTGEWCLEHRARSRLICSIDSHLDIHGPQRTIIPIAFHPLDCDIIYLWCKGGYILSFNLRTGWFEDEFYRIPDAGLVCWWTVFSIEVPPRPTVAPRPCWKTTTKDSVNGNNRSKMGKLKRLLKYSCFHHPNGMEEN